MKRGSVKIGCAAASLFAATAFFAAVAVGQAKKPAAANNPASSAKAAADPNAVRVLPAPATQPIPPADKATIEKGLADLTAAIDAIQKQSAGDSKRLALLPDIQIYQNALRYPLTYNEPIDIKQAKAAIAEGLARAAELKEGKHSWTDRSGPRGYVSEIDASVQPYILRMPAAYKPGQSEPLPLALSCHGRNEKLTELSFISSKVGEGNAGNSTVGDPETKFVAYLYGRFCCANKLAGEIDLLETWKNVAAQYPIDKSRVMVTGFSMGGGAVWHLAAHYGEHWVVATPGAGFSESQKFLHLEQNGEVPPWYETALYHLYNATDQAENFYNCKTIAYAGEIDGQKQAGDVMEAEMAKLGMKLERFIGPKTAHKYEPETKKAMDARVEAVVKQGNDLSPKQVRFATFSLRYPSMHWVHVLGLEKHWTKATVDAEVTGPNTVRVTTQNVADLALDFPPGMESIDPKQALKLTLDGVEQTVKVSPTSGGSTRIELSKVDGKWDAIAARKGAAGLAKRHGLQGPIDDAFLSSFVIVKPSGAGATAAAGWAASECDHAIAQWRQVFRGEAPVKSAEQITDKEIAASNLVLFGDPTTNPLIARILPKLPIEWTKEKLVVNGQTFDAGRFAPVMIYPNPLNPKKYIVLNSGFTFREADSLNNARQTPKLPDYAVVDAQSPPTPKGWGTLPKVGFFGEQWQWQKDDGKIEP